jgi:Putative lumazine-binding
MPEPMALILFLVAAQPAPKPEDRVLATVQQFFDSMAARDVEKAREVLVPEGRFFNIRDEGGEVLRGFSNQEYLDGLASRKEEVLERMWEPEVRIEGGIGSVWTRYDFHRDGAFSHCGVDSFDLVRVDGRWRIAGGIYTVERENCPESPLGPPR